MKYTLIALVILSAFSLKAQRYLVVPDDFTPPTQDMLASFMYQPAMAFIANDLNQKEQQLAANDNRVQVLYFCRLASPSSMSLLGELSAFQKKAKKSKVIALVDEPRAEVEKALANESLAISVIPSAQMLSEGAYGSELGYPRIFILGRGGIISEIITADEIQAMEDLPAELLELTKQAAKQ